MKYFSLVAQIIIAVFLGFMLLLTFFAWILNLDDLTISPFAMFSWILIANIYFWKYSLRVNKIEIDGETYKAIIKG